MATTIDAGMKLGPYEILSPLGEGGMGEVYRARDTRLNREVAIKVLPRAFAEDPNRMARFEREAQLLASLNHPKIAAIYGLEDSGATRALVMELVEGPTLAERIGRSSASARAAASVRPKAGSASPAQVSGGVGSGAKTTAGSVARSGSGAGGARKTAIPLDEALPIAQQVAEALEYAHEHGVVHRDLKPANIKVTPDGEVKVLDFGLAKAMARDDASGDISNSPTLSLAMTEAGLIIGTAAYMAPEQARGKQVDRRADVWAFGCVLYEMLTGQKAFEGETVSDVLAAVIRAEPDWSALPADTPPGIRRLVRRCLAKDPKQRLHDMGDARLVIEETISGADAETAFSGGKIAESRRATLVRRSLPWALGAAAVLLSASTAWFALRPGPRQNAMRFLVFPPDGVDFVYGGEMSISPDGRHVAFIAHVGADGLDSLWVRSLENLNAEQIPGTERATLPFWSPDSQWIAFEGEGGKLEKVSLSGGPPVTLCNMGNSSGTVSVLRTTTGAWNGDGVILFSNPGGLYRVQDSGGTPTLVVAPDPARDEEAFILPQFLPDGRHFLVQAVAKSNGRSIAVGSLNSKSVVDLGPTSSNALYAPPGYIFYENQNTLMARPFDARSLRFTGPAVPMAQNVMDYPGPDIGYFTVSPAGILAYQTGAATTTNRLTWFNRAGQKVGTVGEPNNYSNPALSLDGSRLSVAVGEYSKSDIWIYDLKRGAATRLTFNPADDLNPTWSQDGRQILFSSLRGGSHYGLYEKAADGLESTQPIFQSPNQDAALDDISADGRYAIYDTAAGLTGDQIWVLPLFGDRKPIPFVQGGGFGASSAHFSPNGRYVAYNSTETGQEQIYVQTFPKRTGRWEISTSGGVQPMWRRDGKELYYLTSDEKLMAVNVDTTSGTFEAGTPKELFQAQLVPTSYWRNIYLPSPDGQQFLMITPTGQAKPQPVTFLVNWPALLKGGGSK